jgi:hypothetical protein
VRASPAIVCAALLVGLAACTIGPTGDDGGTSTSTTPARTRGDQCLSVLSAFCQKAASCAIAVDQTECTQGNLSLCCVGTACNATSTISETTVTECSQTIMVEDCNVVQNTTNPTSCLGPP